ncbi:MAG: S8 family serine peptidase, partial [Caldithrix sp.]|nr:S8 family serine peptidase [Caldithrix sp.]
FSSRGGEVNKPDIITPGAAASTVPPFSSRDVMGGTSMASPQAAGAMALLMSAAYQNEPAMPIHGPTIKKAIKNSAEPLPAYLPIDQGSGVINVVKAFEFYTSFVERDDHKKVTAYDIRTESPAYESGSGSTAYWRFGNYFPHVLDQQRFYVNPVFAKNMQPDDINNFYRAYELDTNVDWIKLEKKNTYIKGEGPASIDIYFDKSKLDNPGLYNGKVYAYRKGNVFSGNDKKDIEFELMCTVIVPLQFNDANNYRWSSDAIRLNPGEIKRIYFDIPYKASAANINLQAVPGEYTRLQGYLFDPDGREWEDGLIIESDKQLTDKVQLNYQDMAPGTWELVLYASFTNEKTVSGTAQILFSGLDASPKTINYVTYQNGSKPEGSLKVINRYNDKMEARVSGDIHGFQRERYIQDNTEKYEYMFDVSEDFDKVQFTIELKPNIFNYFTDFAINLLDTEGKALLADGMSYHKKTITFIPPASGSYILQLVPAFATHEAKAWSASLTESYYLFSEINIDGGIYSFYPDVVKNIEFTIEGVLPVAPEDYYVFGELWLDSQDAQRFRTTIPVELFTGLND